MDDDEPGAPTERTFTLMALVTAPAWFAMAWYWNDLTPLLAGIVCQAFGVYHVSKANWRS